MSRTEQAFKIAQFAIESKIWTEKVAYKFIMMADALTEEQFTDKIAQIKKEN